MDIEIQIKDAKRRSDEAAMALKAARTELDKLFVQRSKNLHGIEPGMRVRARGGEYLVTGIRPESLRDLKPWLYGKKFKKDGQPSNMEVTLYSEWEIVCSGLKE